MYGARAGAAWSRLFLPGAGADPTRSEPESAPGPLPSGAGAAQKSGGSTTLPGVEIVGIFQYSFFRFFPVHVSILTKYLKSSKFL